MNNSQIELIKNHLALKDTYIQKDKDISIKINNLKSKLKLHKKEYEDNIKIVKDSILNNLGDALIIEELIDKGSILKTYGRYDENCIKVESISSLNKYDYADSYIHIDSDCVKVFRVFYTSGWRNDFLRLELYRIILNVEYKKEINKTIEEISKIELGSVITINDIVCKCSDDIYGGETFYYIENIRVATKCSRFEELHSSIESLKQEIIDYYNIGIIKSFVLTS